MNPLTVWLLEKIDITTPLEAPRSYLFLVFSGTSAKVHVWREKIVIMQNKYPRLCVRLSPTMKRRIAIAAVTRNKSQGQSVREALKKHFVGSELIDIEI